MNRENNGFVYYLKLMNSIIDKMPTIEATYKADGEVKTVKTYWQGNRLELDELVDFSNVKDFALIGVNII